MTAFSSIRRELKALYKTRAADARGKGGGGAPLELDDASRPGSAMSNVAGDGVRAKPDDQFSRTKTAHKADLGDDLQRPGSSASDCISEAGLAELDYRASLTQPPQEFEHGLSLHQSTARDEYGSPNSPRSTISSANSHNSNAMEETGHAAEVVLPASPSVQDEDSQPEPHEEEAQLTPEEAQDIREGRYVAFEFEDDSVYTQGPVRFVAASDGIQDCGALLMTLGLSAQIQEAVHRQHAFKQSELAGLRQDEAYMRFENKIEIEIANCRYKIAAVRDVDTEKEAALQQQLEILELLHGDVQSRQRSIHMNLETQAEELRNIQAATIASIEEAFVCARLIEENNGDSIPKPEELDLETEYAAYCERLKNAPDNTDMVPAAPPLDTGTDYDDDVPVLTEQEQAHQDIINALWASKETLDQARRDFDEREILRAQEYQANAAAFDRGEPTTDDSPEAFDVRWVKRYGELTRALIDAEAAYADVKRTAFEAEIPLPFADNETVFEGMTADGVGYTVSKEQELVDSVPSPAVRQWLSRVPEDISVGSPADQPESEAGEWEAEEVGISDSVSLVAEGKERARIDRWRKACDAEKRQ